MLIDTHAHLFIDKLYEQIGDVIKRAEDAGIEKIICPAVDYESSLKILELSAKYKIIYAAVGIHPGDCKEKEYSEIEKISSLVKEPKVVAIGETGLDYYWDQTYNEKQKEFFRLHIELAKSCKLPIIIHQRNSIDDCIELISDNIDDDLRGQFHCFEGNADHIEKIKIFKTFFISYCGNITYKNYSDLPKVIATPLEMMLSETDSPYLPPVPFRGKNNEPSYMINTIRKIAELKEVSPETASEVLMQNAERLYFAN
ncbi:TatD family hydrolase [soil metagenome]